MRSVKNSLLRVIAVMVRGLMWWMEQLGKNPSLAHDFSMFAWSELRKSKKDRHQTVEDEPELPAGEVRPRLKSGGSRWSRLPGFFDKPRRRLLPFYTLQPAFAVTRSRQRRWRGSNTNRSFESLFLGR